MNKRIKTKWLKALRSGKYKQGREALRTPDNKFCCLGVLCDLFAKETGREWKRNKDGEYTFMGKDGMPTKMVARWAGLEKVNPEVAFNKQRDIATLSELNDDTAHTSDYENKKALTFKGIAKLIENNL